MNFLLDTNVISEPMKARPNAGVLAWLAQIDEDSVFLSVVTITELRCGIERLASGRRRDRLDGWLRKDLISRFRERIFPVDLEIADALVGLWLAVNRSADPSNRETHSSLLPLKSTG